MWNAHPQELRCGEVKVDLWREWTLFQPPSFLALCSNTAMTGPLGPSPAALNHQLEVPPGLSVMIDPRLGPVNP